MEVETQNESDDLLASAARLVGSLPPQPKLSKGARYRANKKAKQAANSDDFSAIIVTLLTLGLSAWAVPEILKPNEDELNAFSVPATRLLLRHVPLASKLSADALDLVGMIGALSGYSLRTRLEWAKYNEAQKIKRAAEESISKYEGEALAYKVPPLDGVTDNNLYRYPVTPITPQVDGEGIG